MIVIRYRGELLERIGHEFDRVANIHTAKGALRFVKMAYGKETCKVAKKMLIVINGESIALHGYFHAKLKEGDELGFLPICGGG